MATIERIRQRSGLLIVVVFVALLAFLLGDLFKSGGSKFFGDPNIVGSVNGVELSRQEVSKKMEEKSKEMVAIFANSARDDGDVYQGCRVKVHGLKTGESLKYNGTLGTVKKYWPDTGRWDVVLDLDGSHRGLKPANLELHQEETVKEDDIY